MEYVVRVRITGLDGRELRDGVAHRFPSLGFLPSPIRDRDLPKARSEQNEAHPTLRNPIVLAVHDLPVEVIPIVSQRLEEAIENDPSACSEFGDILHRDKLW